jgi:hypothetical protein
VAAFSTAADVVRSRFATLFVSTLNGVIIDDEDDVVPAGKVPFVLPNGPTYEPDPAVAPTWARLEITNGLSRQAGQFSVSQRRYRHLGVAVVNVFTEPGSGDGSIREVADGVFTIFASQLVTGVQFFTPRLVVNGPSGPWYQVTVLAPFQYDELV